MALQAYHHVIPHIFILEQGPRRQHVMIIRWLKVFWPESCVLSINNASDSSFIIVDDDVGPPQMAVTKDRVSKDRRAASELKEPNEPLDDSMADPTLKVEFLDG
ncbi:hypothetical protein J3459_018300 [Metarhizium acridum]|nr:hypothetical protein J3459_018300 [Metarhizium acridum]